MNVSRKFHAWFNTDPALQAPPICSSVCMQDPNPSLSVHNLEQAEKSWKQKGTSGMRHVNRSSKETGLLLGNLKNGRICWASGRTR